MFPEIPCVHHPIKKKCFLNRKENRRERAQGSERLVEWSGGAGEGKGGGRAVGAAGVTIPLFRTRLQQVGNTR